MVRMKMKNFDELPRFAGSKSELVWFFPKSYPGIAAVVRLKPGQDFPEHYHKKSKELYYLFSGRGTLTINKKDYVVSAKDGVLIEPKERHTIQNTGRSDLWFIAVRIPNLPFDSHVDHPGGQEKWSSRIEELLEGSE